MRILVTGDRNWRNASRIAWVLDEALEIPLDRAAEEWVLISGDAMGADIITDVLWQMYAFGPVERHPANWKEQGPSAGPRRNQEMLDSGVDYVVGFHNDIQSSRGTRDMLRRCATAGIPGRLFTEEGEVENWQSLISSSQSSRETSN